MNNVCELDNKIPVVGSIRSLPVWPYCHFHYLVRFAPECLCVCSCVCACLFNHAVELCRKYGFNFLCFQTACTPFVRFFSVTKILSVVRMPVFCGIKVFSHKTQTLLWFQTVLSLSRTLVFLFLLLCYFLAGVFTISRLPVPVLRLIL